MSAEGRVACNGREQERLALVHQVADGRLGAKAAADRLGLTPRQFRRIRRRWEREGASALGHRSRGRPSNRRRPDTVRARALALATEPRYADFGPTLLAEHLARLDPTAAVHPTTLRRWLIAADLWQGESHRPRYRRRRPRRAARGELVLMDSSEHDWLEGRGALGPISLIAMLDDATSELVAQFYPRDTGWANRQLLMRYLRTHGRMQALDTDRAGHFGNWRRPAGARPATEELEPVMVHSIIRRALTALDIDLILALSPQAKGRIERLFGTLQDRLIKEMRIAGITSLASANQFLQEVFLPFWNHRFTVVPVHPEDAHRPLPPRPELDTLFAETQTRVLRRDFTFCYRRVHWQITPAEAAALALRPQHRITIEHHLDGSQHYRYRDHVLHPVACAPPPLAEPACAAPRHPPPRPAADHPWRRSGLFRARPPVTVG